MNENIFKQLLGEMLESDFAEFDNSPEWKPSLKHRLAMKRIFARYERNVRKLKEKDVKQHTEPSEPTDPRHGLRRTEVRRGKLRRTGNGHRTEG